MHQGEGGPSLTTFFQGVWSCKNLFQNLSIGHTRCGGSTGSRELSSWSFSHRLLSCWSCCSRSFSSGVYPDMLPLVPRPDTARPRSGSCHLRAAPLPKRPCEDARERRAVTTSFRSCLRTGCKRRVAAGLAQSSSAQLSREWVGARFSCGRRGESDGKKKTAEGRGLEWCAGTWKDENM